MGGTANRYYDGTADMIEPIKEEITPTLAILTFDADKWHNLCMLDRHKIIGEKSIQFKDTSEHLVIFLDADIFSHHRSGIIHRERIKPKDIKCCKECGRPL